MWPAALTVDDATSIPSTHYDALSDLGLFAMVAPNDLGGLGLSPSELRAVLRVLGAGCGATAFAFAQHQGVVAALSRTANGELRDRWLPALCERTLGGTMFAHLRRPGPPPVTATRIDGGWRIDGTAPWATSWGTAAVFTLAAGTDDGRLVWSLIDGVASEAMRPTEPMSLVTFEATETVAVRFDGLVVGDDRVIDVIELDAWRAADRLGAARPNPLCLGVGDRALALLAEIEPGIGAAMAERWAIVVARAEASMADLDRGDADVDSLAALRTETILATQAITTALLAASGGQGAGRSHPAQLLAREALFYVIQAQNPDGRQATLRELGRSG